MTTSKPYQVPLVVWQIAIFIYQEAYDRQNIQEAVDVAYKIYEHLIEETGCRIMQKMTQISPGI